MQHKLLSKGPPYRCDALDPPVKSKITGGEKKTHDRDVRNQRLNEMFVEKAHSLAGMFVLLDRLGRLDKERPTPSKSGSLLPLA